MSMNKERKLEDELGGTCYHQRSFLFRHCLDCCAVEDHLLEFVCEYQGCDENFDIESFSSQRFG